MCLGKKMGAMVRCVCNCGTERDVRAYSLERGKSKDCGCLKSERLRKANSTGILPMNCGMCFIR